MIFEPLMKGLAEKGHQVFMLRNYNSKTVLILKQLIVNRTEKIKRIQN